MKRLTLPLFALFYGLLLGGCPETVPDVECAFQLPGPDTERVPSRSGFNLVIRVSGEFTAEELAAVHFVSDVEDADSGYEDGIVLEAAISMDDGGCANGCQAGGRVETAITPGQHTIVASALTPRGTAACEASLDLVVNAPPVVDSITLSSEAPGTTEDVTYTVEATDGDGDTVQLSNTWTGPEGQELNSLSLTPIQTVVGETWTLTVTPRDEFDAGDPVVAEVTIANTAPRAPAVTISPTPGRVHGLVRCAVETLDGLDDDDDPLTVTWSWTRNGDETSITEDTVSPSETEAGDSWTCSATVSDGAASSEPASATTTILTPPTVPESINLSDEALIPGTRSSHFLGEQGQVGSPGDVNGDGLADFIVTDNADVVCSTTCEGQAHAYLFAGTSDGAFDEVSDHVTDFLPPSGIIIFAPSRVGDLNGDGLDDISLPFRTKAWSTSQGWSGVYLVFGVAGGWGAEVELEESPNVRISSTGDSLGAQLGQVPCPVGDLDGDGLDDLVLTAPGAATYRGTAYVVYGHPGAWISGLGPDDLSPTFYVRGGPTSLDGTGLSGHELGRGCIGPIDVNADGLNDLVLGAPRGGTTGSGWVLVYLGDGTRWEGEQTSATADIILEGNPIESVDTTGLTTRFGYAMSALGDHDGDGVDDFAISGLGPVNDDAKDGGTVWIASGGDSAFVGSLTASDLPALIRGAGNIGFCGRPLGVDVDGDGLGDLVCADIRPEDASLICPDGSEDCDDPVPSAVRVFMGDTGAASAERLYDDADLLMLTAQADDWIGTSMARLPDLNGDGFDETLVGVPGLDATPFQDSGGVYVVDLAE